MFKKTNFILLSGIALLLLMTSCNKEYYNMEDIKFSVIMPDTLFLDSTFSIKSTINQPLDIRVYFPDLNENHLLGILKPYNDSINCKIIDINEGHHVFCIKIDFKEKKGHGSAITDYMDVVVTNKPH